MEYKYPQIPVQKKSGKEMLQNTSHQASVANYWAWAHSDLNSNAERGKYAEYLVSLALGCESETNEEWGSFDLLTPENIKVEVKSSAYLQTWAHKELSNILFSIRPARAWSAETNILEEDRHRQADIYVFCLENCIDQDKLNPLDLNQWEFYPVRTDFLDETLGNQKTVSLKRLLKIGIKGFSHDKLMEEVLHIMGN